MASAEAKSAKDGTENHPEFRRKGSRSDSLVVRRALTITCTKQFNNMLLANAKLPLLCTLL